MKNESIEVDYLIIGSGIAGLTFALRCAPYGRTMIVTKSRLSDTNTNWAQGGVAAAFGEDDSWRLHEEDTLKAGAGLCDPKAVRFLVQNAVPRMEWLIGLGAKFDMTIKDSLPSLSLGREGGHSRNRIVHHADRSGMEIERTLTTAVKRLPSIKILDYAFCESLKTDGKVCTGVIIRKRNSGTIEIKARAVCLATGSCCRVYKHTTNPPIATGDGIALASAMGAVIENMEFIQFHPTSLYAPRAKNFLLTEALRGEGAILRTVEGKRFMPEYDPRAELAPRDIVARAIHAEILKSRAPFVLLDCTPIEEKKLRTHFPGVIARVAQFGIDLTSQPVPVVPAAHYQCGGVKTDLNGLTSIPGLYAVGEVASTGVHGANRLASNSLLEALVFGYSAAEHAIQCDYNFYEGEIAKNVSPIPKYETATQTQNSIRTLMWEHVGIVRSNAGLKFAQEQIASIKTNMIPDDQFCVHSAQTANLLECARIIVESAKKRKTNVGLHYNVDLEPHSAMIEKKVAH